MQVHSSESRVVRLSVLVCGCKLKGAAICSRVHSNAPSQLAKTEGCGSLLKGKAPCTQLAKNMPPAKCALRPLGYFNQPHFLLMGTDLWSHNLHFWSFRALASVHVVSQFGRCLAANKGMGCIPQCCREAVWPIKFADLKKLSLNFALLAGGME